MKHPRGKILLENPYALYEDQTNYVERLRYTCARLSEI